MDGEPDPNQQPSEGGNQPQPDSQPEMDQPDQIDMDDQIPGSEPQYEQQPDQDFGIDPNQQVNQDFLGSDQNPYGQEMDDGGPVNANGMFNGGVDDDDDDPADGQDEFFDDAGDIGYLPADHVSYITAIL